jgi:ankyrin repeat protein
MKKLVKKLFLSLVLCLSIGSSIRGMEEQKAKYTWKEFRKTYEFENVFSKYIAPCLLNTNSPKAFISSLLKLGCLMEFVLDVNCSKKYRQGRLRYISLAPYLLETRLFDNMVCEGDFIIVGEKKYIAWMDGLSNNIIHALVGEAIKRLEVIHKLSERRSFIVKTISSPLKKNKKIYERLADLLELIKKNAGEDNLKRMIKMKNGEGLTPWNIAQKGKNKKIKELLKTFGAQGYEQGKNKKRKNWFKILFSGAQKCEYGPSKSDLNLYNAVSDQDFELVKSLLQNPNINVNVMLPHGPDGDLKWPPLILAAINNDIKIVEELLQHPDINVNVTEGGSNNEKKSVVECLPIEAIFEHPAFEINRKNSQGKTLLIRLVEKGTVSLVEHLLEKFKEVIDVNLVDKNGNTALSIASGAGDTKVVRVLLEKAKCDCKNRYGETPLMNAARHGHVKIVEMLLQSGKNVDIDAQNANDGYTALMYAAMGGSFEMVKMLLENGANHSIETTEFEETALTFAKRGKHAKIIKLLQKAKTKKGRRKKKR